MYKLPLLVRSDTQTLLHLRENRTLNILLTKTCANKANSIVYMQGTRASQVKKAKHFDLVAAMDKFKTTMTLREPNHNMILYFMPMAKYLKAPNVTCLFFYKIKTLLQRRKNPTWGPYRCCLDLYISCYLLVIKKRNLGQICCVVNCRGVLKAGNRSNN